jgi:hypothetical protein
MRLSLILAVLVSLLAPAADAAEPCIPPGLVPSPALEATCKALAETEAESAKMAAEEAAPTSLNVTLESHHGGSYAEPGYTVIKSETSGRDLTVQVSTGDQTVIFTEESRAGDGKVWIPWSCRHPGAVYSYTVSAGTQSILTRNGHFTGASRYWCGQLLRRAVRERTEAIRQREEVERKHRREALERQRRFEANCRTVGGTPVTIQTREGPYIVCRSQTGGIVPV